MGTSTSFCRGKVEAPRQDPFAVWREGQEDPFAQPHRRLSVGRPEEDGPVRPHRRALVETQKGTPVTRQVHHERQIELR